MNKNWYFEGNITKKKKERSVCDNNLGSVFFLFLFLLKGSVFINGVFYLRIYTFLLTHTLKFKKTQITSILKKKKNFLSLTLPFTDSSSSKHDSSIFFLQDPSFATETQEQGASFNSSSFSKLPHDRDQVRQQIRARSPSFSRSASFTLVFCCVRVEVPLFRLQTWFY